MARDATVLVITDGVVIDGRCHYRVVWTVQPVQARIHELQSSTPHRLSRVHSAAAPAEMRHFVMCAVRRRLSSRHVHHDWYRAPKDDVVDAVTQAVREAEAAVTGSGPPEP